MLEIKNLNTGYDKKQVLFDVSLNVNQGEIVAIIGPNGSGKSTLLKTISGLIPVWSGDISLQRKTLVGNDPSDNLKEGMVFCPQGNRVFMGLSVKENLEIGGYLLNKEEVKKRIENVLVIFPVLKERLKQEAGSLSGGERQMLSIARALIPQPEILLLDEPSLGLTPNLIKGVFDKLLELNGSFNITILIVEQKVREVLSISNRVYALKLGRISFAGLSTQLNEGKLKEVFLR